MTYEPGDSTFPILRFGPPLVLDPTLTGVSDNLIKRTRVTYDPDPVRDMCVITDTQSLYT